MLKTASHNKNSNSFFTLVEVISACVVTAIIVAAAVALINVLQWSMVLTHRSARAIAIANGRIEQMHTTQFFDLPLLEETAIQVDERGVPNAGGLYRRSTMIDDEITTATGNSLPSRQVTVRVTAPWKPGNDEIEVELTTIITDASIFFEVEQ